MTFQAKVDNYRRYPDTIVMGFTKIGGLIALLKITQLLTFYHQRTFEKAYESKEKHQDYAEVSSQIQHPHLDVNLTTLDGNTESKFKDTFTFENLKLLMERVQKLEDQN